MTDELRKAAEQALAYMKSVGEMDMYPEDWAVAMRLEAALAAAPQWIACEERLPEAGVEVLVRVDGKRGAAWSNSYMLVAFLSAYGRLWLEERHHDALPLVGVTHWMPLPAAPEGQR